VSSTSKRYGCNEGFDPVWRKLEGEFVVFDKNSGDIYCFDRGTRELLQLLQKDSLPAEAIETRLSSILDVEPDEVLVGYVESALRELARREIISVSNT
jgi:PqqD family protein of HPr-rel-A system